MNDKSIGKTINNNFQIHKCIILYKTFCLNRGRGGALDGGGGAISHVAAFKKCPSPLPLYICKCYVDVKLSNNARHRVIRVRALSILRQPNIRSRAEHAEDNIILMIMMSYRKTYADILKKVP